VGDHPIKSHLAGPNSSKSECINLVFYKMYVVVKQAFVGEILA